MYYRLEFFFTIYISVKSTSSTKTHGFVECSSVLIFTITNIVNLFLSSGNFHSTLKESAVSLLLKNLP